VSFRQAFSRNPEVFDNKKGSSTYVIPEVFNRESGVIWQTTISPIEQFGDERPFKKRLDKCWIPA